jgi:hypothetical protein
MIFVTTKRLENFFSHSVSRATVCLIFSGSGVWPLQLLKTEGLLQFHLYYREDLTEWPDTSIRCLAIAITKKRKNIFLLIFIYPEDLTEWLDTSIRCLAIAIFIIPKI